jgi:hypothetical protein
VITDVNEVMKLQKSIEKESRYRRTARRIGVAGIALATLLTLGACKATGGGQIDAPLESGVLAEYTGDANFGFNFTCEVETAKKRTVIRGEITYHDDPSKISVPGLPGLTDFPEVRIHGTVKPIIFLGVTECGTAVEKLFGPVPEAPPEFQGIPAALFEGTYRSQDSTLPAPLEQGEFTVLVGDQGEPARQAGDLTGDLFAIDLYFGEYPFYTRGGYIEGGNIQVDNT